VAEEATIITPENLLAWHRRLIAQKYEPPPAPPARTPEEIETLMVGMAQENRDWGYERIPGGFSNLGHIIDAPPQQIKDRLRKGDPLRRTKGAVGGALDPGSGFIGVICATFSRGPFRSTRNSKPYLNNSSIIDGRLESVRALFWGPIPAKLCRSRDLRAMVCELSRL
jgi:hypothetical protein